MTDPQQPEGDQPDPQEEGHEPDDRDGDDNGEPTPPKPEPKAGPELETALREERKARAELQKQLDQMKQAQMSDQEKAVAQARAEGAAEANRAAALKVASAEFRHAATGRIADPAAALELLDVSKLLGEDGEPDAELIAAVVDRLAAPAAEGNGHGPARVPAGPRQPANDGDFFRSVMRGRPGR